MGYYRGTVQYYSGEKLAGIIPARLTIAISITHTISLIDIIIYVYAGQ